MSLGADIYTVVASRYEHFVASSWGRTEVGARSSRLPAALLFKRYELFVFLLPLFVALITDLQTSSV